MNRYRHTFTVSCPNNGAMIRYHLAIETPAQIMVEKIVAACGVAEAYHEDLADKLYAKFGGRQVMRAYHHGVWVETERGAS